MNDRDLRKNAEEYSDPTARLNLSERNYIMGSKEVTFEVIKDIYWDNWGHLTKVFKKGDICKGIQYSTGVVVAESPYYEGVSDMVDLEHINIIKD